MSDEAAVEPSRGVVQMTFARRAGTAALVLLAARTISIGCMTIYPLLLAYGAVAPSDWIVQLILQFGIACVVLTAMVLVLANAQRSINAGKHHWLASMPEARIVLLIVALVIVSRFVPRVAYDSSLYDVNPGKNPMYFLLRSGLSSALAVAACYVWIWWCNSPPRVERLVAVSAIAWCGFELLFEVFDMIVPTLNVLLSRTADSGAAYQLPGADAYIAVHARAWLWRVSPDYVGYSLISWATNVALYVPIAAIVAVVIYAAMNRRAASAG